jgi:hypothetical protein
MEWKHPSGCGVPTVLAKAGEADTVWITGAAHAAAAVVTAARRRNSLRSSPLPLSAIGYSFLFSRLPGP